MTGQASSDVANAKAAAAEGAVFDCAVTVPKVAGLTPARIKRALRSSQEVSGQQYRRFADVGASDVLVVSDGLLIEFELVPREMYRHISNVVVRALSVVESVCSTALESSPAPEPVSVSVERA